MDALDMNMVQAARLDADRLAAALFGQAASAVSGLALEERAVADLLVGSRCVHIIEFFTRRPEFVARTEVDQSKTIGTLLDRTPDPDDQVTKLETTLRQRCWTSLTK